MSKNSPNIKRSVLLVFTAFVGYISVVSQNKNSQYLSYIEQYCDLAMDHQKRFKIPSSITLAQGLLESGAGRSALTIASNNHFGIKCNNGWAGPHVLHDDDRKDDCFRKYNHAHESYEDHSQFLNRNPRYAFLFEYNIRDYRNWATGLQRAGYATDKSYANKLIKVIEDYSLFEYDLKAMGKGEKRTQSPAFDSSLPEVFKSQGLLYVVAKRGDTYESLAERLGFNDRKLLICNEVPKDFPLEEGDIVYLQMKNKKVKGDFKFHIIQPGESIHSIAQMYGVRMKYIYKINKLTDDYIPNDGDTLKLKK
ncbi:MAG: glucosaminidase domain-containing protein [Bacteroidales bacterium]|nr:glucosaminidase domain-containing protein [Bacteroidales bacterium]